jgi:predicted nuclease of predicted toxin-antitoxin system
MLSGYVDENVKAAIVSGLRQRGMDLVTAEERNQRQTDDEVLLATATSENRLILTNDTDFCGSIRIG